MKKALVLTVLVMSCAAAAFAADESTSSRRGQGMTIEQKKVEILQHIEERISNSQLEKACVQAAKSHEELMACREKYRPKHTKGEGRGQGMREGERQ